MRHDTSDEYTDAFLRFVTELVVRRLLRDQDDKILEDAKCDKDIDIRLEHPTGKPMTIESKRLAGQARDEEIKLCFQQGQSPVDLAISLDKTPEFVLREAKRILGEAELKH